MPILMNHIKEDQILNSYNFARNSDVVYSEMISKENFENLNKENVTIIYETDNMVFYKKRKFSIKENDIVFCNTHFIESLFHLLKDIKELKNIKLITHQTDIPITKKLYNTKPRCISEWYSINIDTKKKDLIPIPLGVSNDYSPKNPKYVEFKEIKNIESKENKIYLNFEINTNRRERFKLYDLFKNNEFFLVEKPTLSMSEYLQKLNKNLFILCPWGNGYDSHRFWESMYVGSIPIIKKHITYDAATLLPHIQVDSYKDIDFETINNSKLNFDESKFDYNKLTIDWWLNKMKAKNVIDITKRSIQITEEEKLYNKSLEDLRTWTRIERRNKEIKRYIFKVYKLIYYFIK